MKLTLKVGLIQIGDIEKLLANIPRADYKPENIITAAFTSSAIHILEMQQMLFWMKTSLLIKLADEARIIENFSKFCLYYFKVVKFIDMSKQTDLIVKAIWKISFVNENYKYIESFIKTNSDRSQHWMVTLLSMMQESYYELAKIFYKFNDDFTDLFARVAVMLAKDDVDYD